VWMNDGRRRRGSLELNPELAHLQVPRSDRCWWCGDMATTEEHRIKASSLRRVARLTDGTATPGNVFKKSSDYESALHSLQKGTQVRWRRNLCANCNNSKSQPFDRAYDDFEAFLVENLDVIPTWKGLDWRNVYGPEWRQSARNLARYFGKQLGCLLASHQLRVPPELVEFLNGNDRCPSVWFALYVNPRAVDFHQRMLCDGFDYGLSGFIGLLESNAYQTEGVFSGIDHGYHIGYLWLLVHWRDGAEALSWFEGDAVIDLPRLSDE